MPGAFSLKANGFHMPAAIDLPALARQIMTAQDEVRTIAPFTALLPHFDLPAGYAVARLIHEAQLTSGAAAVGRKIGFTNPYMWQRYGVRAPIWAHVYDTTVVHAVDRQATVALGKFSQPKLEPEIVLHFHASPPAGSDVGTVLRCIDWIASGFEVVQSHCPDWKFEAPDAVADFGLHAALVVGEPQPLDRLGADVIANLQSFELELSCDGVVRDVGRGSNVLGSPLAAAVHLIAELARRPAELPQLQAGEIVTTGTLTAAWPVHAGETWSTAVRGLALPGLEVRFSG